MKNKFYNILYNIGVALSIIELILIFISIVIPIYSFVAILAFLLTIISIILFLGDPEHRVYFSTILIWLCFFIINIFFYYKIYVK